MAWEPMSPSIEKISPAIVDNDRHDVAIKLHGAGFEGPMSVLFVASDGSGAAIAGNQIEITAGSTDVKLRICPFLKDAGTYDMYVWLAAPPFIEDKRSNKNLENVPVNAMAVRKRLLTVVKKIEEPY